LGLDLALDRQDCPQATAYRHLRHCQKDFGLIAGAFRHLEAAN
jgi:hypothetical protein